MNCLALRGDSDIAVKAIRFSRSLIVALSLIVSTAANARHSRPQSSTSEQQEWERMFAASPQRELKREWDSCVNTVADLIIAQGGTLDQIRQLAVGGCADEESRLTGAMVREFGYDRGNRAVQGEREVKLRSFERRIAARSAPPRANGVVATTREGWEVRRYGPQNCAATLSVASIFGTTLAYMRKTPGEDTLAFGELGSDARSAARFLRAGDMITVSAVAIGPNAIGRNTNIALGRLTFGVGIYDDGFAFLQPMDAELLGSLEGAVSVQLFVDIGREVGRPHTYRIEGITSARQALLECAAR